MNRALRVVGSFMVGYVVTAGLSVLTTTVLRHVWPDLGTAAQGTRLEVLDFTYALVYMGVGGYLTARLGGAVAAGFLGLAFVVLGLSTAGLHLDTDHSAFYQWALAAAAAGAVLAGAHLAQPHRGTLPEA